MSQEEDRADGLLNTAIFAALLVGGAVLGHFVVDHVLPGVGGAQIIGYIMLPVGVIIGVSFGEGVPPPLSILRLFSVFDHRHSLEEVADKGAASSVTLAIPVGTAATCALLAGAIVTFIEVDVPFGELFAWFAGVGVVYGAVVAGMVALTTGKS